MMTPELSRVAALGANLVTNDALAAYADRPVAERATLAQIARTKFLTACEVAGDIAHCPDWVRVILDKVMTESEPK